MESELEDLNPKSNSNPPPPEPTTIDDASTKDDRPLLKPEPSPATTAAAIQPSIEELEKKYAAYVRHDVYGTMGRGELPWTEKVLLGFALVTLLPLRVAISLTILVVYYLICRVCTLFSAPNREEEQEDYAHMGGWRRTVVIQSGRFLARAILFVIGFYWIHETYRISDLDNKLNSEVECKDQSDEPERPGAIVSNHVSYLDILYHMSASFPSFVAKRSVGKLPLVGLISKCLGCVYVQRESRSSDFKGVSGVVNERVREAHQNKSAPMMLLFPGYHLVRR